MSNPPSSGSFRLAAAVLLIAAAGGIGFAALNLPRLELEQVVPETAWADLVSPWVLAVAVLLFAGACLRARGRPELLLALWLGVLSALAALRELDLHVLVNPGNIHLLGLRPEHGVRFRLDWWIGGEAPVLGRIVWAVIALVLGALVILPFAAARIPWVSRLRRREPVAVLLVAAAAAMAGGYILDDLIARTLSSPGLAAVAEEGLELAGEVLLAVVSVLLVMGGRGGRQQGSGGEGGSF